MKMLKMIGIPILILLLVIPAIAVTTLDYGSIELSSNGATDSGHFYETWDLTACPMTISSTYDATRMVDDAGAHAWTEFGVRTVGDSDFNPTWDVEGSGVWLATDYDWTVNTFDPDPVGFPTLDLDDKLILQKAGGHGEGDYNLPSAPPASGNNHRFWWDRDGVDPWQNPATANTGGIYQFVLTLQKTTDSAGTAYMKIRNLDQGFETDGNWNTIELTPAGMTFTGDMKQMQVFYGLYGYGAPHTAGLNDISVTGCLVLVDGMATGGGWYIPEAGNDEFGPKFIGEIPDGKATFGFIAKQKDGKSSGNLEFQYHADNFKFKSTAYESVTVSSTQAIFWGVGTIEGREGTFKFRVNAFDADKTPNTSDNDRFAIRIWTDDVDNPVHRSQGDLSGGQIVVHKK